MESAQAQRRDLGSHSSVRLSDNRCFGSSLISAESRLLRHLRGFDWWDICAGALNGADNSWQ